MQSTQAVCVCVCVCIFVCVLLFVYAQTHAHCAWRVGKVAFPPTLDAVFPFLRSIHGLREAHMKVSQNLHPLY